MCASESSYGLARWLDREKNDYICIQETVDQ